MQILDNMLNVLKTPFVGELDLVHLFLLVGVVIFFIVVWGIILHHMKLAASALAD